MTTSDLATSFHQSPRLEAPPKKYPRVWPALLIVCIYWSFSLVLRWWGGAMFTRFLAELAADALLILVFSILWSVTTRIRFVDRLLVLGAALAGGVAAFLLSGPAAGNLAWLMLSIPWLFTGWAAGQLVFQKASAPMRRYGLVATVLLAWSFFALIRTDGLSGEGQMTVHWRWTLSPEEIYLAERARRSDQVENVTLASPLTQSPGDWPGFRGPGRVGVVRGISIDTDWSAHPPQLKWRQRIGPAWSSVVVIGDRLFTQEQRGNLEAVVCLDAANGREIWAHEDSARWSDGQAGPGPRATPTFADGSLFALGATGILNCLDAGSGKRIWSHDIAADADVKIPVWGFASSPLVVHGLVIVFAGGDDPNGLLAYRADSGDLVWRVAAGKFSYSSPHLVTLADKALVLFLSDRGLLAIDPDTGSVEWEYDPHPSRGLPWSLQPQMLDANRLLIASSEVGTALIDLVADGPTRNPTPRWTTRTMKPSFNDFVVYAGCLYGFDGGTFCCLDCETGTRRWRKGDYEHGQVVLLADQGVLLVVSEEGDVILVAADPTRHRELGRISALSGKTWNHPVVAHARLYVRNAEEIACYELKRPEGQ